MKNLIALLCCLTIASCDKNNVNSHEVLSINNFVHLRVQDKDGIDLLNEDNAGSYAESDIKILDSDFSDAVTVRKWPDGVDYFNLSLELNCPEPDKNTEEARKKYLETYIAFGDNEPDTIKGLFAITFHTEIHEDGLIATLPCYKVQLQKAWFNGELIFDKENTTKEYPIVIKAPNQ
ncbi:MAG: hypothetical protein ACK5IJ_11135 [Mangrovibacterium sp.]